MMLLVIGQKINNNETAQVSLITITTISSTDTIINQSTDSTWYQYHTGLLESIKIVVGCPPPKKTIFLALDKILEVISHEQCRKQHFRASRFHNFLGEHAHKPPGSSREQNLPRVS